jgi:tetratricopeptide (TPR) repeat protein
VKKAAPPARRARTDLWIYLGLLVAIFAVYAQVHGFEFINYDDPDYVTGNTHVRSGLSAGSVAWAVTSTDDANWFALTRLSHLIDVQLFGMDAGAQHAVNAFIHALSALLLFAFLKRITGADWPSAFVAFVFAVHPLHVESVAWISERKDVLSGLFWMIALVAYARYVEKPGAARYAMVMLALCCGVMAKPMIVTLPFALLLVDYWLGRGPWKKMVVEKLPLLAIAVTSAVATYVIQQHGGAVSNFTEVPLGFRIANAVTSYWAYLWQFVVPANLAVFYPYVSHAWWTVAAAAIGLVVISAAVLRPGAPRYLAAGWLWYLGTLLPVIGLIQVGAQSRADRYTYIPLIGISIMIAFGTAAVVRKRPSWKIPVMAAAIVVCGAWAILAWQTAGYWQSSIALFQHAVAVTDANYVAYNSLGDALRSAGRADEAIRDFKTAVEIKPSFADAHNNLGEALLGQGRLDEAMPHLVEAIRLDPKSADARVNLGTALRRRGMPKEAEAQYRAALEMEPENAEAYRGLGNVLADQNRAPEAMAQYREALRLKPEDPDTHYDLGLLAAQTGDQTTAIAEFSQTVRLQPSSAEARFNLGTAFAQANRFDDAVAAFQEAVKLKPDYVRARFNLASALANLQRFDDAAHEFEEVLRLEPDSAQAREGLALCRQLAAGRGGK